MFVVAYRLMFDIGFTPEKGGRVTSEMRKVASASIEYGWRVPAVKWLMVESLAVGGVGIYAFYALQPYLLELYGDPQAYQVAGLVAAIIAGAQILGGIAAPKIRRRFDRRTSALIMIAVLNVVTLALIGLIENFWAVLAFIVVWGLLFAAAMPIRQSYERLIRGSGRPFSRSTRSCGSTGGVWAPAGARTGGRRGGYAPSYVIGAGSPRWPCRSSRCRDANAPRTPGPSGAAGGAHCGMIFPGHSTPRW
jgi:MFS family permease